MTVADGSVVRNVYTQCQVDRQMLLHASRVAARPPTRPPAHAIATRLPQRGIIRGVGSRDLAATQRPPRAPRAPSARRWASRRCRCPNSAGYLSRPAGRNVQVHAVATVALGEGSSEASAAATWPPRNGRHAPREHHPPAEGPAGGAAAQTLPATCLALEASYDSYALL